MIRRVPSMEEILACNAQIPGNHSAFRKLAQHRMSSPENSDHQELSPDNNPDVTPDVTRNSSSAHMREERRRLDLPDPCGFNSGERQQYALNFRKSGDHTKTKCVLSSVGTLIRRKERRITCEDLNAITSSVSLGPIGNEGESGRPRVDGSPLSDRSTDDSSPTPSGHLAESPVTLSSFSVTDILRKPSSIRRPLPGSPPRQAKWAPMVNPWIPVTPFHTAPSEYFINLNCLYENYGV